MTQSISTANALKKRPQTFCHPSWLGSYLSGDRQCHHALHLQANWYLPKLDSSFDLVAYKVAHQSLVNLRATQYREWGYQVFTETANEHKVKTSSGVTISCCPDIVAIREDQAMVIDAKTGNPRGKDIGQVQLYMMTLPLAGIHGIRDIPSGQVFYRDELHFNIDPEQLTSGWKSDLAVLVALMTQAKTPEPTPSIHECKWCPAASVCAHRAEESPVGHCDWL